MSNLRLAASPKSDNRPTVRVTAGKLPYAADRAERALLESKAGVYARGTSLVRVVTLAPIGTSTEGITRPAGASVIVPFDRPSLVDVLTRIAQFEKWDGRMSGRSAATPKGDWKPIDCPPAVADTLISRRGAWRFPQLRAVVSAPTMRADGSILDRPGFDPTTGILFQSDVEWPAIPNRPTREAALAALKALVQFQRTLFG
jgi:putative DNA primase/helicase